jgi:hypothetical protein
MSAGQHGLDIDADLAYHRCFWKAQRVGWILWALILLAAIIGLVGPGLKGKTTVSAEKSQLSLTYERVVHYQTPSELNIQLPPADAGQSDARLTFNRDCIESMEVSRIDPEPDKNEIAGDKIIYTFNRTKPRDSMTVVFQYETKRFGKIPIQIQLDENQPLITEQCSFP